MCAHIHMCLHTRSMRVKIEVARRPVLEMVTDDPAASHSRTTSARKGKTDNEGAALRFIERR